MSLVDSDGANYTYITHNPLHGNMSASVQVEIKAVLPKNGAPRRLSALLVMHLNKSVLAVILLFYLSLVERKLQPHRSTASLMSHQSPTQEDEMKNECRD